MARRIARCLDVRTVPNAFKREILRIDELLCQRRSDTWFIDPYQTELRKTRLSGFELAAGPHSILRRPGPGHRGQRRYMDLGEWKIIGSVFGCRRSDRSCRRHVDTQHLTIDGKWIRRINPPPLTRRLLNETLSHH